MQQAFARASHADIQMWRCWQPETVAADFERLAANGVEVVRTYGQSPDSIAWEIRFVRCMVRTFREHPSVLAWDLGNECNCMTDVKDSAALHLWISIISMAIRLEDSTRRVLSGMHPVRLEGTLKPSDQGEMLDVLTTHTWAAAYDTFALAKKAHFAVRFASADQPLPPSVTYMLPSVKGNTSVPRRTMMALMERIREGATLYLSLGVCVLSPFEELTGLHVLTRSQNTQEDMSRIGDTCFQLFASWRYDCACDGTEALAFNQKVLCSAPCIPWRPSLRRCPGFWMANSRSRWNGSTNSRACVEKAGLSTQTALLLRCFGCAGTDDLT